jgi:hypothetical protein
MYTHLGESQSLDDAAFARRASRIDLQLIKKARQDIIDWLLNLPFKRFRSVFKRKTAK